LKKSLCTNLTFSTPKFYKNANTTGRQVKHEADLFLTYKETDSFERSCSKH